MTLIERPDTTDRAPSTPTVDRPIEPGDAGPGLVTVLTSATFDEAVAGATTPVLVDFTATWCPPCHVLKPVLRQIAAEQAGRLAVAEVDIDAHPDLAVRYSVMSAPTMVLLVDGQPVRTLVGSRGRARLLADLSPHLG